MPCIKVVTATQGKLILQVNSGGLQQEASGVFPKDSVVLDRCYWQNVVEVMVQNDDGDPWTGSILYSLDGGKQYQTMRCTGCSGSVTHTGTIIVDSAAHSSQVPNKCLNGTTCSIVVDNLALYCIRFTTCSIGECAGWISVSVDLGAGLVAQGGELELQSGAVWERCYEQEVEAVQVTSAQSDKWRGAVEHSSDGSYTYASMKCADCQGGSDAADLVVTPSSSDVSGSAKCLNGGPCQLQRQGFNSTGTNTTWIHELQTWSEVNGWIYLGHNGNTLGMFFNSHVGTRWLIEKHVAQGVRSCSFQAVHQLDGGGQFLSTKDNAIKLTASSSLSDKDKWVVNGFC